jgi:hypothetical protein
MRTLSTAIIILIKAIGATLAFTLFILLEIYCVSSAIIHLEARGIQIGWLLWVLCAVIIIWEVFSFCFNFIWKGLVMKLKELFTLK